MNLKKSKIVTAAALAAGLLLTLASCGDKEPSYEDRETVEKETFVAVGNTVLTFASGISAEAYAADTPTGAWLDGCDTPDRNDQFDAYTLRHESAADGNTTFTYLIYYPHEQSSLAAKATIAEGDSGDGYVLSLSYGEGSGTEGYSLCYLSFTLPTNQAPRLRIYKGAGSLGLMSTVTSEPIPAP
jgi:hypothetical protein